MSEIILTSLENQIFELVLNRVDKRNALNKAMMEAISAALDAAEKAFNDGEARVLIVRANGSTFSSGIDLMGFEDYVAMFGENWRDNLFAVTEYLQQVLNKLEKSSLPTICVMHGHCIGSGLELALACDFRIVAQETRLALPEAKLGIIPDVGGTVRLLKLVGPSRAKELIMTGRDIDLARAESWGIVNYVVPQDEGMDKAHELAQELIEAAPMAVNYAKRVINDIVDNQRGLQLEAWAQAQLFRTEDFERGMQAMMMRDFPVEWKGK